MAEKDSDFLKRLLKTFKLEAQEHIDALFAGIDEIEKSTDTAKQAELIETIFREAHSLKGAARSVNLMPIETACQALENTFAMMKNKQVALNAELFDKVHQAISRLSELLELPPMQKPEAMPAASPETPAQTEEIVPQAAAVTKTPPRVLIEEKLPRTETVRIAKTKLDCIFLQAEEMLVAKLLAQQHRQDLQTAQTMIMAWSKDWSELVVRQPEFHNIPEKSQPQWMELIERNSHFINALSRQLDMMTRTADQDQRLLEKMVDDLLDNMKKALMLPVSALTEIFPRLVRDLAKDSGKNINLDLQGGDIEADRRILEEIKDPLIHLLRNCIDHGIETPAERINQNKPSQGKITIAAFPCCGNCVEIDVSDDGAGINVAKVKDAAARLGIIKQEALSRLDRKAAVDLIYQSGVSTNPEVTKVSGRGLGLAIVREKVEQLGGGIMVETQAGVGTTFCLKLPLTVSTYSGIALRVATQLFVVQTSNVERSLRIRQEDIRTLENHETIQLGDDLLALVWLNEVLEIPGTDLSDTLLVLILAASGKRMAFVVDEVLGEQEVLVKSLGPQLSRVRNISAATILGSGKVVPILNVADLLKSALQTVHTEIKKAVAAEKKRTEPKQTVLVVEDSITSRSLLKGILEVAGYDVATAVDGIDGLSQLNTGNFDLVVSDIDMPRMSGLELTAKIRSNKKLAALPIVLVTAQESTEDRARGFALGANAYIVKHSFERSNLLEAVRRLI